MAIVHFAGIHADETAGAGFDLAAAAPGRMAAVVDEADAVLVVGVAREGSRGGRAHGLQAGERQHAVAHALRRWTISHRGAQTSWALYIVSLGLDRLAAIDLEPFPARAAHLGPRIEELGHARELVEERWHGLREIDQHVGMPGGHRSGR